MDNSKDIHYSDEAKRLFRTVPPLLIRSGNLSVAMFVLALVVAGFSLQVPYRFTATICYAGDGVFLIENKTKITKGKSFEIVLSNEKKITISSYQFVSLNGIPHIQFAPKNEDSLLLNDFGNVDECAVQYVISLTDSYFNYLLRGI